MDKYELENILARTKADYPKSLTKYQAVMKKHFPEKDCSGKPSQSTRSFLFPFLYGEPEFRLPEPERGYILNFIRITDCIEKTESVLKWNRYGNRLHDFVDSSPMEINGEDILITDPCYLHESWESSLRIPHIEHSTIYGDWSCAIRDKDTGKEIGKFCADAGMVGVFLLKDAKNCPGYDAKIVKYPHIAAVIPNFSGIVTIKVGFDEEFYDYYCYVEGEGSVNFESYQVGF